MSSGTNNFGVGTKEVYQRTSFVGQLVDGQSYWDARMVLFDFFYAYQCGYIKNYFPTPGFSMDEEKVIKCIKRLDFEWNKEAVARAGKVYTGGAPKFEDILLSMFGLFEAETISSIYKLNKHIFLYVFYLYNGNNRCYRM